MNWFRKIAELENVKTTDGGWDIISNTEIELESITGNTTIITIPTDKIADEIRRYLVDLEIKREMETEHCYR